jgi:hypothetical protein
LIASLIGTAEKPNFAPGSLAPGCHRSAILAGPTCRLSAGTAPSATAGWR